MDKKKTLHRQRCQIFSRIVGYLRPVNSWNDGKQEEFKIRSTWNYNQKD